MYHPFLRTRSLRQSRNSPTGFLCFAMNKWHRWTQQPTATWQRLLMTTGHFARDRTCHHCHCYFPSPGAGKMDASMKMVQIEMKHGTEAKSKHPLSRSWSFAKMCCPIFHIVQNPVSLPFPSWGAWSWWDAQWWSPHHTLGIKRLQQPTSWLCSPVPCGVWCED